MTNAILILRKDFNFNKNLSPRYKCVVCEKLLLTTYQTPCGCRICRICGEQYFEKERPCPTNDSDCNSHIQKVDLSVDRASDREILKMTVQCVYKPCNKQQNVQEMDEHFSSCEFRPVACAQCDETVTAKGLNEHKVNNCIGRLIQCQYCAEEKSVREIQFQHHNIDSEQLCEKFCGMCPNQCDQSEPVLLKKHLQECPLKKMECPYMECKHPQMNMENLLKHFREKEREHVQSQTRKNQEVLIAVNEIQEQIKAIKDIFQDLRNITETTASSYIKLEQKYEELKSKTSVNVISTNIQPILPLNGNPYVWKVTDYDAKWNRAVNNEELSIRSDPFYTRTCGYKLCLRLYPNGDGAGKNTHMSIYFAIMKSEHDLLLSWPFHRQVTFTLIHPGGELGHKEIFKTGAGTGYDRPTEESNIGQGAPRFITQTNLRNTYLREDCIFIRISVND